MFPKLVHVFLRVAFLILINVTRSQQSPQLLTHQIIVDVLLFQRFYVGCFRDELAHLLLPSSIDSFLLVLLYLFFIIVKPTSYLSDNTKRTGNAQQAVHLRYMKAIKGTFENSLKLKDHCSKSRFHRRSKRR